MSVPQRIKGVGGARGIEPLMGCLQLVRSTQREPSSTAAGLSVSWSYTTMSETGRTVRTARELRGIF